MGAASGALALPEIRMPGQGKGGRWGISITQRVG